MTPHLRVPALGIDQIISPRTSGEDHEEANDQASPTAIPDVGESLVHLLAEGHTDLDADGTFLGVDLDTELGPDVEADEDLAGNLAEDECELPLGADPDTALVGSIFLHLLSEHERLDALHLNEQEAMALHDGLHLKQAEEGTEEHPVADLRFRHRRAMAAAMRCAVMDQEADEAVLAPTIA